MAGDMFLKIDGVDGESKDDAHGGEIDILSWSWGESNSGGFGTGGGGGTGKVSMQDFSFSSQLSKASPVLKLCCASGKHLTEATLTVRKAGEDQQEYFKVIFGEFIISSYQLGGAGDGIPMESFSINFSTIKFEYCPQKDDGTLDSAVEAGWDCEANKKL